MKKIEIRKNGTKRVYTVNNEPSVTDSSFAEECDVNYIISKFHKTGQISHLAKTSGVYADISEIPDLHSAMSQVVQAQEAFDALPAELRRRFGNSPVELVNFLQDPSNDEEAVKLGLKELKTIPKYLQNQGALNDDDSNDDEPAPIPKKTKKTSPNPPAVSDDSRDA